MEIQSITTKLKHECQYTCRGSSDCAVAQVALKLTIYSLHVCGKRTHDGCKTQFWPEILIRISSRD